MLFVNVCIVHCLGRGYVIFVLCVWVLGIFRLDRKKLKSVFDRTVTFKSDRFVYRMSPHDAAEEALHVTEQWLDNRTI